MAQKYIQLLTDFYNEVSPKKSWKDIFDVYWDEVRLDLYFGPPHERGEFPSSHQMPDTYFLMTDFCASFDDVPANYEAIAEEIHRVSDGRELETIFICDRCSDGEPGEAQWERGA